MRHLLFAAILAASLPAFSGDIQVTGTTAVAPGDMAILTVASEGATGFYWTAVGHNRAVFDPLQNGSSIAFSAGSSGEYRWVVSVREGEIATPSLVTITVGKRPEPTPDVDPVPDDDDPPVPVPPEPKPEAILGGTGFRVMILYEAADTHPPAQQAIFTSTQIRDYLLNATALDGDQRRAFRIWDDDYSASQIAGHGDFTAAYPKVKAVAKSLPWIVAENGDKRVSQPLPANVEDTLALLKSIGG